MTADNMERKRGIYIHMPFCVRKCRYCAFLSFNAEGSPRKEYTDALEKEINTPNASDLMVYNVEGKLMATYHVQAGVGELTVDVEDYPAGVYIYRMNSRSGRFIVQ